MTLLPAVVSVISKALQNLDFEWAACFEINPFSPPSEKDDVPFNGSD